MPVTIQPITLKYKNGTTFQSADCLKGDPGDPSLIIDDNAGDGDINKTWSADKLTDELGGKISEPSSDGTSGQVLTTDGNGGRSWTTVSSGGSVSDVQINGTSILSSGVANVPVASTSNLGVVKIKETNGIIIDALNQLTLDRATDSNVKQGTYIYRAIVPSNQHQAVFYGLAKCAGDSSQSSSSNAVGVYTPQAKAAIWNMLGLDGSAFVKSDWELIREDTFTNGSEADYTISADGNNNSFELTDVHMLVWFPVQNNTAKYNDYSIYFNNGNDVAYRAVVDTKTQESGATSNMAMASVEQNDGMSVISFMTWGTTGNGNVVMRRTADTTLTYYPYPLNSETITSITLKKVTGTLNYRIYGKRKTTALDSPVVNVSGTTPSITALPGHRYICGECSTLTITVPTSGCIDVVFESGSTATVLTVIPTKTGVTAVKWANGFDPTSLETNTRYEVIIDDGEWGMACSWT